MGRQIPQPLVPAQQLKLKAMTAPERYLLSRMDGERTLEAIVEVAPIRELEALKLIRRFVAEGWVRVE